MLNFSHGSGLVPGTIPRPAQFDGTQVTEALDLGFIRHEEAHPHSRERRIGAASLGDPCLRKLVYQYTRAPETAPDPRMYRILSLIHI